MTISEQIVQNPYKQLYSILQYMMSTNTSALDFYSSITANPQLLANGYPLIKDYLLQGQQQRRDTLLHLLHPQVPVLALILNLYPNEIFTNPSVSDTEKDSTMQYLLELLQKHLLQNGEQVNGRLLSQLFQFLHKIHNVQGYQSWVGLYLQTMSKVSVQPVQFSSFLINLFRQADDRISVLSEQLIPKLIDFQFPTSQDKLEIYYYFLKSLAFKVDTDPQTIDEQVRPHLSSVLSFARTNMRQNARCLKFSLKTMTVLFGDYGEEVPGDLITEIQTTTDYLMAEYLTFLNVHATFAHDDLQQEDQPIEVALYQMLELLMTLFGSRACLTTEKVVYLCLISTYLSQGQYNKYCQFSDQYLMDVEDEGQTNIRNKSTYFLTELIQHSKIGNKCVQILTQYCHEVLLANTTSAQSKISTFLQKYRLPLQTLRIEEYYIESALFVLYSFTDELLEGKVNQFSAYLLELIKNRSNSSITPILAVLVLNKCARTGTAQQKQYYLSLLLQFIHQYSQNVGMLIAISRGIYLFSSQEQLFLKDNSSLTLLMSQLIHYLFRQDSAQDQSAYLVLQFMIHCLNHKQNSTYLQQLIPFEKQIHLLKRFLSTGMTSSMMIEFTAKLGNPSTLTAIFKEILGGYAKDQNLAEIISKSIRNKSINLNEEDIVQMYQVYSEKLDLVSAIIAAFVEETNIKNEELIGILSQGRGEWQPGLLKHGKLKNFEQQFLKSVQLITNQLQSPQQIQNQLLVPYYAILNNTKSALTILNSNNILIPFFQKLYKYAKLFQGIHLKIVTSHIFISLAEELNHLIPTVRELVKGYGSLQSNQWEDQDDFEGMGEEGINEGIIEKMFGRIVNDRVENTFKSVFGEVSWDSKALYHRLQVLKQRD